VKSGAVVAPGYDYDKPGHDGGEAQEDVGGFVNGDFLADITEQEGDGDDEQPSEGAGGGGSTGADV